MENQKHIVARTNLLVCLIIVAGFLLTAILSYKANYSASLTNIEQVSGLTSEGIYYQMSSTFTKPVNISLTMANDSLLKELLLREEAGVEDPAYIGVIREYLRSYQEKYGYDSVFLVSCATGRYYNYAGLDRVLLPGDPENGWYFDMLAQDGEYSMNVDNDQVVGAGDAITLFVNCKIKGPDGEDLGVVGVGTRIDTLQSLLQSYQDEFGVNAYLIDDVGTIEISTQLTGYEGVNLFETDGYDEGVREAVLSWKRAEGPRDFWALDASGGKRDYIVTRYLPEIGWHLVVERDTHALVERLNSQLITTMLIIALIILVILLVITKVIRSFNKRIVSLTQAVEQERQNLFQAATEELFENIYELDITRNRPANQATEDYFAGLGVPRGTPYDECLRIVVQKQIKPEFRQGYLDTFLPENVLNAFEQGVETLNYEFMTTQDGKDYYWMRITARLVRWEMDGSLHMLTYRQNIDAEKRREYQMQAMAQTDEMTGLLNKAAAQRKVEERLRQRPGDLSAFFIFDIDKFKAANDQFGHSFGDGVIRAFTSIIRASFRKDDIVGRLGGDEFTAFLAVPDRGWAERKAEELVAALDRDYSQGGRHWHMSGSIGIALAPQDGTDFETLYQRADSALYEVKLSGRNGFKLYGKTEG